MNYMFLIKNHPTRINRDMQAQMNLVMLSYPAYNRYQKWEIFSLVNNLEENALFNCFQTNDH
jgi:hypothetical protein